MIEYLSGKKTYILAVVAAVINLAVVSGWINVSYLPQINIVLGALGVGAIRAGIAKSGV